MHGYTRKTSANDYVYSFLGIDAKSKGLSFVEIRYDFSKECNNPKVTVPTLQVGDEEFVTDSWAIAKHVRLSRPTLWIRDYCLLAPYIEHPTLGKRPATARGGLGSHRLRTSFAQSLLDHAQLHAEYDTTPGGSKADVIARPPFRRRQDSVLQRRGIFQTPRNLGQHATRARDSPIAHARCLRKIGPTFPGVFRRVEIWRYDRNRGLARRVSAG